jgi:hypothetical protein
MIWTAEISSATNPLDAEPKPIATTVVTYAAASDRGGQFKFTTTERSSLQLRQQLQSRLFSSRLHGPAIYSPERV